jgi:glycosyltransferase involved in cell wall biosynthesis
MCNLSELHIKESCMRLSLIIPAHNEEARIIPTLQQYEQHLREHYGGDFEIIVVANGCTDNTAQTALDIAKTDPQIKVIDIGQPIGKGGAILQGFREAQGQRIAFADADGATDPESLLALIKQLDYNDVVIGSRRLPNSVITIKQPWLRRAVSAIFAMVVYLLFGLRYHDTQCGAKAFRRSAALQLAKVVNEQRWVFDVDLLLSAEALNLSVAECPIVWTDKAGSHLRLLSTGQEVLRSFWSLWRRQRQWSNQSARLAALPQPDAPMPALRILALNWRCLQHPQAGGSEINLFEQARVWVREGHSVTVFCADPGRQYAPSANEIVDGIQVIRRGGRLSVYFFAALFLLWHGREYDRVLDIANGVPFFAPLFCAKPVTLLVHHVHGRQWFEEFPYPVAALGWAIEQHIVPLVYRGRPVIAVSPTTREGLIDLGITESQIHIVYNGVSHPSATPATAQLRPHSIAYVGRIKQYKRLDRVVRAVAALRHIFPDIHFDIAGDGDARATIEALIAKLGLADYVTVYGPVDDRQKATILSSAAVFATASMHEGWGISVIEANAYGCPAVAFDVPGLRVAIRNGTTGLLASDDADFEPALAAILRDQTLRERLSRAARRWASSFDWALSARATLELLYTGGTSSATQLPFEQRLDIPPAKPMAQEHQYETKPLDQWLDMPPAKPKAQEHQYEPQPLQEREIGR